MHRYCRESVLRVYLRTPPQSSGYTAREKERISFPLTHLLTSVTLANLTTSEAIDLSIDRKLDHLIS